MPGSRSGSFAAKTAWFAVPVVLASGGGADMHALISILQRLVGEDEGATMVEYGLMVVLIAIAAVGSVAIFGSALEQLYQNILDDIVAAIH
jgi:pilus assembly protein Flp/PilA